MHIMRLSECPPAAILAILASALVILAIANVVFSLMAERKCPPMGGFIECDGVRLHYLERGNPAARYVVGLLDVVRPSDTGLGGFGPVQHTRFNAHPVPCYCFEAPDPG
jgi:hypothetical protein